MTSRTTVFLLLATIATFGAIYYFQSRETNNPVNAEGDERLFEFEIEDVARIELQGRGEKATFEKEKFGWFMRSPIKDRMDAAKALLLIRYVHGLAVKQRIPIEEVEDGEVKLEELGLDEKNRITLRLKDRSGKQIAAVVMGNASPLKTDKYETSYVQLPDDESRDDIFVVAGHARIEGGFNQLRDLRAFAFTASVVDRVLIKRKGGEIELLRRKEQKDRWDLVRPLNTRADASLVKALLTRLTNVQALEIMEKDPLHFTADTEADVDPIKVTLWTQASEEGVDLEVTSFEKDGKRRLIARASDRDFHLHMPDALAGYLGGSANSFRDRKLTDLPRDHVSGIKIAVAEAPNHVVNLVKDGNYWFLESGDIQEQADNGKVKQFIEDLNRVEVLQFASNSASELASFGFEFPDLVLTISSAIPSEDSSPPVADTKIFRFKLAPARDAVYSNIEGTPFINKLNPNFIRSVPARTLNWRSLNVLDFSTADVREIVVTPWKKAPMKLDYDVENNTWTAKLLATENGEPEEEITELLSPSLVGRLATELSVLTADRWISENPSALQALETPTHTFAITLQRLPDIPLIIEPGETAPPPEEPTLVTRIVELSPRIVGLDAPEFYYGRSNASPDIFMIKTDHYKRLASPVLDQRKLEEMNIPAPSPKGGPQAGEKLGEDPVPNEGKKPGKKETPNPVVKPIQPDETLEPAPGTPK